MTLSAYLGVLAALAAVLGLIALLVRPLRAMTLGTGSRGRGPGLEVVSRAALTPRQGVAAVRFRGELILVSYGDGGVRLLKEGDGPAPDEEERAEPSPRGTFAGALESSDGGGFGSGRPLGEQTWNRIRSVARGMGTSFLLAGLLLSGSFGGGLTAQEPPDTPPMVIPAPEQEPTGTQEAEAAPGAETAAPGTETADGQSAPGSPPPGAATALDALSRGFRSMEVQLGEGEDAFRLSGPVGTVVLMGFLTLLPTLVLLMTGFTRILVVLHLLRQALGTQAAPPAHLLAAMALLLTGFVMAPTLGEVNRTALAPWMEGEIGEAEMLHAAAVPFRGFMLESTREQDLQTFLELQEGPLPGSVEEVPLVVITSAFITSELRNAFQMGFALFLPFVVIDLVVASVLMSMGMFMLPPVMVSLPFKLLLFVLVDGWSLVVGGIVRSFPGV